MSFSNTLTPSSASSALATTMHGLLDVETTPSTVLNTLQGLQDETLQDLLADMAFGSEMELKLRDLFMYALVDKMTNRRDRVAKTAAQAAAAKAFKLKDPASARNAHKKYAKDPAAAEGKLQMFFALCLPKSVDLKESKSSGAHDKVSDGLIEETQSIDTPVVVKQGTTAASRGAKETPSNIQRSNEWAVFLDETLSAEERLQAAHALAKQLQGRAEAAENENAALKENLKTAKSYAQLKEEVPKLQAEVAKLRALATNRYNELKEIETDRDFVLKFCVQLEKRGNLHGLLQTVAAEDHEFELHCAVLPDVLEFLKEKVHPLIENEENDGD